MTFEKEFPSLEGCETDEFQFIDKDGKRKVIKIGNMLNWGKSGMLDIELIQQFCLDKQRVLDVLERNMSLRNGSEIIPKIKKELKL